jgi:hypothetical protein
MNDPGAATWYASQARLVKESLQEHVDHEKSYIRASVDVEGPVLKVSNLYMNVVLGVVEASIADGDLPVLSIATSTRMPSWPGSESRPLTYSVERANCAYCIGPPFCSRGVAFAFQTFVQLT